MTPVDIATDIESLGPIGVGDLNQSVNGTNSYVGQNYTVDDWRTWD